ncbi:MAG: hypothetical protein B7O98_00535 [Zestosphaera tikiterensis]|uniref:Radical SAM core domain-containing protein n=1 Tax=Zestosphaera tikiterensis TaxID=1973259 RepID=A0A2R7Y8T6_9CREN|nr:MAG: hypothetical protein B7O98_00535 [Zestosphaera tikiterensis]
MVISGRCDDIGCWVGKLPKGCKLCMEGLKSVVFTTGLCPENCFYCPISLAKKGKDVMYVNETPVRDLKDLLMEVVVSGSKGVGVTGGDPLVKVDDVVKMIKHLKEFLGDGFHIHLYTTGFLVNDKNLTALVNAGLDELRIHVTGEHSFKALKKALEYPIDVGVENPVLPNSLNFLKDVILKSSELGVKFVNLNELEASESNYEKFLQRGFKVGVDGVSVEGSKDVALEILKWVDNAGIDVSVHFCPAVFKDRYQFRKRLRRRFVRSKRVFEWGKGGLVKWIEVSVDEISNSSLKALWLADLAFKAGDKLLTGRRVGSLLKNLKVSYDLVEGYPTTPRKVLNVFQIS